MLLIAILMLMTCLATAAYFSLTRRRRIPKINLELDKFGGMESSFSDLAGLTGGTVATGNEVVLYQNGSLLNALMEAISACSKSVHFEAYAWTAGRLERQFVSLLCDKAREGVSVRILVDALGGIHASGEQLAKLRDCGVHFAYYHRLGRVSFRRFNSRNHRKLAVIDGETAFVFGHGIADTWCGDAQDENHWRDTGARFRGPVVCELQVIYMRDWIETRQQLPLGEGCFMGDAPKRGEVAAHVVSSSTRGGHSSVAFLYLLAIATAKREIIIQNPYFAPEEDVTKLLERMVQRGVTVHLMLPGRFTDSRILRRASQHLYGPLLRAGVNLYEFEPTLSHQKIVIIDNVWSHIGSTNFDARSLALNAELGIGMLDRGIAAQLRQAFEHDLTRCRQVTLSEWRQRAWYQRLIDWCAYQLHSQI